MTLLEATSAYWKSPEGIQRRCDMIGADFTFKVVNNALKVYGNKNKVRGFIWAGSLDERTCPLCDPYIGNFYSLGRFLPSLPQHSGCRCEWLLVER